MGIKIEKIAAQKLGPIDDFSQEFGIFNLIYSKNEGGKTFLTEFIIRSLFKNIKRWQFRENGFGKVTVSGLPGGTIGDFSPNCSKKLEDYWQDTGEGLPLSMVNLLVSKGGEASIEENGAGISKSLIKEVFSGISLLDKIADDKNISRTIKNAKIENGSINISNTGEGKTYRASREEIEKIDSLFSEIESKYATGILESLKIDKNILKEQLEKLQNAKRYEAFQINKRTRELNKRLMENDEDELNDLYRDISIYETKKNEYENKTKQYQELRTKSVDYEWLEKVLVLYEKALSPSLKKPNLLPAIAGGVLILISAVFSLLNMSAGAIISAVIALVLFIFFTVKLFSYSKKSRFFNELDSIKKEFLKKTGRQLENIAALNVEIDRQKESYNMAKLLESQLDELRIYNEKSIFAIQQKIKSISGSHISEENWRNVLDAKKNENRQLKNDIESLMNKQAELGVRDIDYINENPGIKFSYDELEKIQSKLENTESLIQEKEREIESLKIAICAQTKDDYSIGWESLIENLREKRSEIQESLDIIEAQIIAGIIVNEEVTRLRREEDVKIAEGLKSEIVLKPLSEITVSYKSLFLDNDNLMISDNYRDFDIKDLSTGAREQVMLALRIGFCRKLLKQDSLFFILDDAFQHSDWQRRQLLIKKLADIASNGWQIIYFSMDDHIKSLFDSEGSRFENGQYKFIEL